MKNLVRQELSPREREVLGFLADGKNTAEIAKRLHIGVKTVYTYYERLRRKLGAQNYRQLIRSAFLLRNVGMDVRFEEWLKFVGSIEMRYFDLQGKLIATQRILCSATGPETKRHRR